MQRPFDNDYRSLCATAAAFSGPFRLSVSVVVPTYNCASLAARTLAGLQLQTYPPELVEVIVADDGSSDGIEAVVERFQAPWRLHMVRQEDRGFRLASVRNLAIRAARHDVIVSLDGDMLPTAGCLAAHLRWFHVSDRVATIGYRRFVDPGDAGPEWVAANRDALPTLPEIRSASNWFVLGDRRLPELERVYFHPAPYNLFHGCNVAYRRRHALEIGLFDEAFDGHWGYEDNEFAYRLWRHGVYLVPEPDALALHQENTVTPFEERVRGDQHNFELACAKIPGFREFKRRLHAGGRKPWW